MHDAPASPRLTPSTTDPKQQNTHKGLPTPDYFFTWQASGEPFTFPLTVKTTSIFGEESE